ncbi:MAG TPA: DNA primase [Clostridiales bacterium]|jgi:DNA primase|nr:DNA primase [Clostridiales bacterium]
MAFPESFLHDLAERNEIEEVVSGYVKLTKRSGQNLFGLCPFHSEKTPSFSVSPSKQIYHCFGCGKGGSVINFIMEIENLSFPEAVEFLARRAGMPMPEQGEDPMRPRRERLYNLNRDAARFFYGQLLLPGGEAAREYISVRGIGPGAVKSFGLGFAPDSWDALNRAMKEKGYTERELTEAALVRPGKKGGVYDTFRNRLMFPVIDVRGNVTGFSGRALGDGEPKYLNSPETAVFSKSHQLFALNLAKKSKSGYIILVEGNIDVVTLHQAGFDNTVASLGTSLTQEQARLLSRYTNEIVIAYDADEAGKKAAQRAITLLEKLEMKVRVLTVQGAKDPDEYLRAKGADAFRNLLEKSENHIEYRLQAITGKYDLSVDEEKVAFLREATDLIAALPGAVEREVYAMRAAAMSGVSAEAVTGEVARRRKRKMARARREMEREILRPARTAQPRTGGIRYENLRSAAAEEGVIRLLYLDPALFLGLDGLEETDFSSPELWRIYVRMRERADTGGILSVAAMSEALGPEGAALLTDILQKPESAANGKRALEDYIDIIKTENAAPGTTPEDMLAYRDKQRSKLKEKKGYGG